MENIHIVFTAPGIAELKREPVRQPKENEVLLKTLYSVISNGTERACLLDMPNVAGVFPRQLGYCAISRVVRCGKLVTDFIPGDRALVYHGTHSAYVTKTTEELTRVTEPVDSAEAAFVIIAAMGLGGVRKLMVELGESAMVMGLGLLGLFAAQFLRLSGVYPVIAADPDPWRRELALATGADFALDPLENDFPEKVKALTWGKGVNATVEVSGAASALRQALDAAAWKGRIALLGCTRVSDVAIDYYQQVHRPGITLIGAHNFVRPRVDSYPGYWTHQDDCRILLRFLAAGKFRVREIMQPAAAPSRAPELYAQLARGELPAGVYFDWSKLS